MFPVSFVKFFKNIFLTEHLTVELIFFFLFFLELYKSVYLHGYSFSWKQNIKNKNFDLCFQNGHSFLFWIVKKNLKFLKL